jgi:sulfur relay (sulfurtransferase) DsrF/TusC family protein
MNPSILFIITSDPRKSPRPAEAIRIAAGVGTWKKANVSVYLRDAAVLALSEFADEFVDEDNYTRYCPIIGEFGRPVYVQRGAPLLAELGEPSLRFQEISDDELASLAAQHRYTARF